MLGPAELPALLRDWEDRLGRLTGMDVGLRLAEPRLSIEAWSVGGVRGCDERAAWWGLTRHHAIVLGAGLLMFPDRVLREHLASSEDNELVQDAFGEVANLAFATVHQHLREARGAGVRVWKHDQRLFARAPDAPIVASCELRLPGHPVGELRLHAA